MRKQVFDRIYSNIFNYFHATNNITTRRFGREDIATFYNLTVISNVTTTISEDIK